MTNTLSPPTLGNRTNIPASEHSNFQTVYFGQLVPPYCFKVSQLGRDPDQIILTESLLSEDKRIELNIPTINTNLFDILAS